MAISLRRALIASRNLYCALRTASVGYHQTISCWNSSYLDNSRESSVRDWFSTSPAIVCNQINTRRGYAKGRKQHNSNTFHSCFISPRFLNRVTRNFCIFISTDDLCLTDQREGEEEAEEEEWDDDDDEADEGDGGGDLGESVKATAVLQMEAAIDALSRELGKLRTGRASAGMLDHITVEHYGVKTPLNRMAVVSVLDPKTLSVTPYDPNDLKELDTAIISSPLGLNPKSDNQRLIVPIPPLTKEHMQAVCKVVAKSSEDVKQSIRRARQKALDIIKKAAPKKKEKEKSGASISEDDAKRLEKEIDEMTKKFIKNAEDMCKAKDKEIRGS